MANKDRDAYNAYMRDYMLRRYHRRRDAAIKLLGGKCVVCGTTENLELDHVYPSSKGFELAKIGSYAEKTFRAEIAKCQLLCRTHHAAKTMRDLGQKDARTNHGTISSYRYCRCALCKEAKSRYSKEAHVRRLKKASSSSG